MRELPHNIATAIEAASIPPLPQVLVRLIQEMDDERASIAGLATIVSQDAGLCARILTAVNSAALHRARPVSDIQSAMTALGTRLVRSMATCLAVKRLFDKDATGLSADLAGFWHHSLLVAETTRALAVATGYPHPDEAYLAGLLHDVGELLLLTAFGEQYAWLLAQTRDETDLPALEQASLGTHHAEAGAWLADQWQLDSALADGILFHHATAVQIATATMLPRLVWFADAMARNPGDIASLGTLAAALFDTGGKVDVEGISVRCAGQVAVIARALGVEAPPMDGTPVRTVPNVVALPPPADGGNADRFLEATIRDIAVMHPLQQDLFGLESDAELLLSLRESARILFDLPRMGFLLLERGSGMLTGKSIGGQAAIFRQTAIAHGIDAGLTTRAMANRTVCSSFDEDGNPPDSLLDRQLARALSTDGVLTLAMTGKRRMIGVMVFGLGKAQHARLKRRMPWLLNFGRIGGVSLEAWQDAMAYRKQAEDEASAAFRQRARRIVHEAGNPLGIIRSYLRILDGKLPGNSDVRQEIDVLREEIDRVAAIVQRMSELPVASGRGGPCRATTVVRELLALYGAPLFGERGIVVSTQFADDTEKVACDADSLKQMLVNLWKNAAEAMPAGGQFDIEITGGVVQNGRRHVGIRMQDTGAGMSEAAIRRLQFPDESHTETERGHGLSIVGGLAARAGGKITCRSRAGAGTTLTLLLPCVAGSKETE